MCAGETHQRHEPVRMCLACRRTAPQSTLVRLRRTGDGPQRRVQIDLSRKQGGRGAYLCPDPACWKSAMKRRSLERALRLDALHPDDRAALMQFAQSLEGATVNER